MKILPDELYSQSQIGYTAGAISFNQYVLTLQIPVSNSRFALSAKDLRVERSVFMVVSDKIELGPRASSFDICSDESCEGMDFTKQLDGFCQALKQVFPEDFKGQQWEEGSSEDMVQRAQLVKTLLPAYQFGYKSSEHDHFIKSTDSSPPPTESGMIQDQCADQRSGEQLYYGKEMPLCWNRLAGCWTLEAERPWPNFQLYAKVPVIWARILKDRDWVVPKILKVVHALRGDAVDGKNQ
ncbi:unnamed protein product, partial [Menidia menidia]